MNEKEEIKYMPLCLRQTRELNTTPLTIEKDIIVLLDDYADKKKLNLASIENCETILQRYKNKLYVDQLTYKLYFYLSSNSGAKVVSYESYNSNGDNVEKIGVTFGNRVLNMKYEVISEKLNSQSESKVYNYHRFYIDGYLILKKERDTKKRDFVNLTYVSECIENLKLNVSLYQFMEIFLKLFDDNCLLIKLIQQFQNNDGDAKKHYFKKAWDSDSDVSVDNEEE